MEMFDYTEARSYAMRLGLVVGGVWIVSFLIFVLLFPSFAAQLSYFVGLSSVAVAGLNVRRYRKQESSLTFFRCWWILWFTFMCAVLLTTAAQYVYFAFIDGGRLFESLMSFVSSKEVVEAYAAIQASDMLKQMQEAMAEVGNLSVKDLVMSMMSMNLMLGLLFSVLSNLFLIGSTPGQNARNENRE